MTASAVGPTSQQRTASARRFHMPFAVWADSVDVPLKVCTDARLRAGAVTLADPDSVTYGQGGWDVGIHFANVPDLASQLGRLTVSQTPPHMCPSPYRSGGLSCSGGESFCGAG